MGKETRGRCICKKKTEISNGQDDKNKCKAKHRYISPNPYESVKMLGLKNWRRPDTFKRLKFC